MKVEELGGRIDRINEFDSEGSVEATFLLLCVGTLGER